MSARGIIIHLFLYCQQGELSFTYLLSARGIIIHLFLYCQQGELSFTYLLSARGFIIHPFLYCQQGELSFTYLLSARGFIIHLFLYFQQGELSFTYLLSARGIIIHLFIVSKGNYHPPIYCQHGELLFTYLLSARGIIIHLFIVNKGNYHSPIPVLSARGIIIHLFIVSMENYHSPVDCQQGVLSFTYSSIVKKGNYHSAIPVLSSRGIIIHLFQYYQQGELSFTCLLSARGIIIHLFQYCQQGELSMFQTQGGGQSPTRSSKSLAVRRAATSAKSKASSQSVGTISQHHVLYLDKEAILSSDNSTMHEELQVLEKQQSTGSLNIQPRSSFPATNFPAPGGSTAGKVEGRRSGAKSAKFDRICKGSVVHKLRRAKSGGLLGNSMARGRQNRGGEASKAASSSSLVVVGDKFASPNVMSPLLRTQTQFSLSSQRMTMNSPDLYAAFERLPPLEQVRISLRQMDSHPEDGYIARGATPYSTTTSVGVVEELKPLVKYSPDVRAQYNRQIKYY